jgi:hypothetical protein
MTHRKPRQSSGSWSKNKDKHQGKQHNSARGSSAWVDQGRHTNSDRNRMGGKGIFDFFGMLKKKG